MKQVHPTYLSLVVATHRDANDSTAPAIITGFGMFNVCKLDRDGWRFSLNASVADTIDDEAALLTRLADTMPQPDLLVGEHIESRIFAPLLQTADRIPPPVGAFLGMRVARLRLALPIDVALGWARRSAPLPYAEPALTTPAVTVGVDRRIALVEAAMGQFFLVFVFGRHLVVRKIRPNIVRMTNAASDRVISVHLGDFTARRCDVDLGSRSRALAWREKLRRHIAAG